MAEPVILGAIRTPYGRRDGAFRNTRPDRLLAHALQSLVRRSDVDIKRVGDVITGCVTQCGEQGINIGRRAVLVAGFPITLPAVSLNRACGSSQQAVHFAAQAVAAGDHDYAIGCGVESMTRVPMFSDFGNDWTMMAELGEKYEIIHQGESAERLADKWKISRAEADAFGAESHRRASAAAKEKKNTELVPTPGLDSEGKNITLTRDEGIRDVINVEKMATLPLAFRPPGKGIVTPGNSSQISDGASAVLIGDREVAKADGLRPLARFRARVVVGDDPTLQLTAVIPATQLALEKAKLTIKDLDWIEVNEAFATVVLAWGRELKPDMQKVNPWGGAIAHGHPLGASGAGLMAKMLAGLAATGGRLGLQTMCIGHGMATATIIERV